MKKLKLISLLCAIVMLAGCFTVIPTFAETASITNQGGDGSAENPYVINQTNFADFLANANDYADKSFILNENVSAEGITLTKPIATDFSGTFDGNGKTISDIKMVGETSTTSIGIFEKVSGTVKNLVLVDSYFESTNSGDDANYPVGSICAILTGTISNCYVDAVVKSENYRASNDAATNTDHIYYAVGGIVGKAGIVVEKEYETKTTALIEKTVFAGSVSTQRGTAGGFVGVIATDNTITFSDCMNLGSVSSTVSFWVGGFFGYDSLYKAGNVYVDNCVNLSADIKANGRVSGEIGGQLNGDENLKKHKIFVISEFRYLEDGRRLYGNFSANSYWNSTTWNTQDKSLAELVDADNKILANWTYKEGCVPNPTTHDVDGFSLANVITASVLGLKTEGEIRSIRISTNNPGLRFETIIDADMVATLEALGVTVGNMTTYITAANFIGAEDTETTTTVFTKEALEAKQMPYLEMTAEEYLRTDAEDDRTAFAGSVTNVNDIEMKYIAVGSVTLTVGDVSTELYATWNTDAAASVKEIAELAAADYSATVDVEKGHVNQITRLGESVYSRYTQAQYDVIAKLCCLQ